MAPPGRPGFSGEWRGSSWLLTLQLDFLQQRGEVLEGLVINLAAVVFLPGAAEQFLGAELVQLDQSLIAVGTILAAFACVLGGDAHQTYSLALQHGFDLVAQIRLWLVQS